MSEREHELGRYGAVLKGDRYCREAGDTADAISLHLRQTAARIQDNATDAHEQKFTKVLEREALQGLRVQIAQDPDTLKVAGRPVHVEDFARAVGLPAPQHPVAGRARPDDRTAIAAALNLRGPQKWMQLIVATYFDREAIEARQKVDSKRAVAVPNTADEAECRDLIRLSTVYRQASRYFVDAAAEARLPGNGPTRMVDKLYESTHELNQLTGTRALVRRAWNAVGGLADMVARNDDPLAVSAKNALLRDIEALAVKYEVRDLRIEKTRPATTVEKVAEVIATNALPPAAANNDQVQPDRSQPVAAANLAFLYAGPRKDDGDGPVRLAAQLARAASPSPVAGASLH